MKFVTISRGPGAAGCIIGEDILDFGLAGQVLPAAAALPAALAAILDERSGMLDVARRVAGEVAGGSSNLADALRESGALRPSREVNLLAPLPRPLHLFSHGQAYHSHVRDFEPDTKPSPPSHPPAGFLKNVGAIAAPGEAIALPAIAPDHVDFEGEFCVVFGRECFNVSRAEAMDHVVGYTIINDISARDWIPSLRAAEGFQTSAYSALNILYKAFPTFCPMGPNITTKDEIGDYHDLELRTELSGELMQQARIGELIWDIPELIEFYATMIRFQPGDIMSTGTPGGVGAGRQPPRFMRPGDVVTVSVTGVGALTNPIAAGGA